MKANFGILPPLDFTSKVGKRERGSAYAERALADLQQMLSKESGDDLNVDLNTVGHAAQVND